MTGSWRSPAACGRSHNTALLRAAAELAPEGVEVELYEGLDRLPRYNEDRDDRTAPAEVAAAARAIEAADAVLFATPGVQRHLPGQLKHAVDWASRPYGRRGAVGQAGRRGRRQRDRLRRDVGAGPPAQGARASPARACSRPSSRSPRRTSGSTTTAAASTTRRASAGRARRRARRASPRLRAAA